MSVQRAVLDDLSDGVLVVGMGGRVETLNPAAQRILGLDAGEALGRTFAELFITREGFDAFTELVVYAKSQSADTERRVVEIETEGATRSLAVATSHLKRARGEGAREAVAVIAVFSDITELRELRESELRLAREAEIQHERLQEAYRQIENRNTALAAALRRVRIAQALGASLVVALFVAAALWTSGPLGLFDTEHSAATEHGTGAPAVRTHTVTPRPVSTSVTLRGRLAPWRTIAVRSPVGATIAALGFAVGDTVAEGQMLVEFDLSHLERRHQRERVKFVKARELFEMLDAWETSPQMAGARRNFAKAKLDMESGRNKIKRSRFLFDQGLIAREEFEDGTREHESQRLDFEAAEEELAAMRAQGGETTVEAARIEMEAARADMLAAAGELESGRVRAPLTGVILKPQGSAKALLRGASVRKGDVLVNIGDYARMAAFAQADEVDIGKLKAGQAVSVIGNAFRALDVRGVVSRVAREADPKSRGIAKFDVAVTLDPLEADAQALIRSGMSGQLRIVTYANPKGLLVPIEAVETGHDGHTVRVLDPDTGEPEEREVRIGPTTHDSVEITAGLAAGDTVVVGQQWRPRR